MSKSNTEIISALTALAAEKGMSAETLIEKIKAALKTLFENDSSSARPEGSMEVCRLYWWKHKDKTPEYSSARIHRSVHIKLKDGVNKPKSYQDYEITNDEFEGAKPEIIDMV